MLSDLEIPQETLMQELEIHGHLRYNLCCILSAFQVSGALSCCETHGHMRLDPVLHALCLHVAVRCRKAVRYTTTRVTTAAAPLRRPGRFAWAAPWKPPVP